MNMERLTWRYWWGNNWQLAKISSTTPTLKKSRETVCNINKIKRVWRQQFKAHFFFFFILSTFSHVLYTATKVVNHPFHNPTFRRVLWLHRQHAINCNVTKFNTLNKLVMWWKNGLLTCWYLVRLHLYFYSTTNTAPLHHCFYLIGFYLIGKVISFSFQVTHFHTPPVLWKPRMSECDSEFTFFFLINLRIKCSWVYGLS